MDSWCLWFWSHRHCRCNRWGLWQLCKLGRCRQCCRNARSGRRLWCGCCDIRGSVSGLDTAFMKVLSCVAVDHAITGVNLVAVFGRTCTTVAGIQILWRLSYIAMGWLAYRGAGDLHCLSTCDLEASEWASNCSQIWRAARSVLQILAGMVVLIWHQYRSSAGEGSLALMGVAWSAKRVCCGLVPLYLAHWSACFMDLTHASVNPFNCG